MIHFTDSLQQLENKITKIINTYNDRYYIDSISFEYVRVVDGLELRLKDMKIQKSTMKRTSTINIHDN